MSTIIHLAPVGFHIENIAMIAFPHDINIIHNSLVKYFRIISEPINNESCGFDRYGIKLQKGHEDIINYKSNYIIQYGVDGELFKCWINDINIIQVGYPLVIHLSDEPDDNLSKLAEAIIYGVMICPKSH